jgi:hypothetical protein
MKRVEFVQIRCHRLVFEEFATTTGDAMTSPGQAHGHGRGGVADSNPSGPPTIHNSDRLAVVSVKLASAHEEHIVPAPPLVGALVICATSGAIAPLAWTVF